MTTNRKSLYNQQYGVFARDTRRIGSPGRSQSSLGTNNPGPVGRVERP